MNFQVVSAMVKNDLLGFVNERPLDLWKETLAILCTVFLPTKIKSLGFVLLEHRESMLCF